MKKILSLLLAVIILTGSLVIGVSAAQGETVFAGGGAKCTITVPANCKDTEKYAAKTLQKYIKEITGEELTIFASSDASKGKTIYISTLIKSAHK